MNETRYIYELNDILLNQRKTIILHTDKGQEITVTMMAQIKNTRVKKEK